MYRGSVPTDARLQHLLQSGRRAAGNLSQRTAAKRAGISSVYWQKIESGAQPTAPCDTLAAMFTAVGVTAKRLRDEGYPDIADAADELESLAAQEVTAEEYLAATPGASPEEISALQAVWLALRAKRTTEPLEEDFMHHTRRTEQQPQRRARRAPPTVRIGNNTEQSDQTC